MTGNDLQFLNGLAQRLRKLTADITVRGSVEAITANVILLVKLVGNGIERSSLMNLLLCFIRKGFPAELTDSEAVN